MCADVSRQGLGSGTVLEFLQVRRILEPEATAMAAERITAPSSTR
jgi:DNA-binding FadR family transcriptional regulator